MTPTPVDDEVLLERARCGDDRALEDLLRLHLPRIHAVCRRMCRDPGDAEDAAQNALVSIARGLGSFDGRSAVSSWIYRVTTNACLDELRRRRRRPVPVDTDRPDRDPSPMGGHRGPDPEAEVLAGEQRQRLREALDQLPAEYRTAVVLRDVADLDYATIAEITDVPVGTVRSRIARGRGRLADALAPSGTESAPASSDLEEDR